MFSWNRSVVCDLLICKQSGLNTHSLAQHLAYHLFHAKDFHVNLLVIKKERRKYHLIMSCYFNRIGRIYKDGQKSSYNDSIYVVDDFFDQWDPSTVTPMEEKHEFQWRLEKLTSFDYISSAYFG